MCQHSATSNRSAPRSASEILSLNNIGKFETLELSSLHNVLSRRRPKLSASRYAALWIQPVSRTNHLPRITASSTDTSTPRSGACESRMSAVRALSCSASVEGLVCRTQCGVISARAIGKCSEQYMQRIYSRDAVMPRPTVALIQRIARFQLFAPHAWCFTASLTIG